MPFSKFSKKEREELLNLMIEREQKRVQQKAALLKRVKEAPTVEAKIDAVVDLWLWAEDK